jgi:hypothetical protein
MVTIISTHPVNVRYNLWRVDTNSHTKVREWDCLIRGGAGVATGKNELFTPSGVATEISEEALEKLMKIPSFTNDIKNGMIKVLKNTKAKSVDADEQAVKDLDTNTNGKQITAEDLEADGAEINDDGSVDVSGGGKDAVIRKKNATKNSASKKTTTTRKKRGK